MPAEGGQAGPGPEDRARLAADALARAREDARARGEGLPARGVRASGQAASGQAASGQAASGQAASGQAASGQAPGRTRGQQPREGGQQPRDGSGGESGVSGVSPAAGTAAADKNAAPAARRAGRPRRARRDDPEPLRAAIGGLLDARGWRQELAVGGLFGRWDQIVGAELAAHTRPEAFTDGELLVTADSTAWATQVRLLAATLVARVNAELGGPVVRRVKVRGPAPPPPSGRWRVRGGRGPRGDYG